jgi:hypothetical protein
MSNARPKQNRLLVGVAIAAPIIGAVATGLWIWQASGSIAVDPSYEAHASDPYVVERDLSIALYPVLVGILVSGFCGVVVLFNVFRKR